MESTGEDSVSIDSMELVSYRVLIQYKDQRTVSCWVRQSSACQVTNVKAQCNDMQ